MRFPGRFKFKKAVQHAVTLIREAGACEATSPASAAIQPRAAATLAAAVARVLGTPVTAEPRGKNRWRFSTEKHHNAG